MKLFGIGLSKTGNTSLVKALDILGYKSKKATPFFLNDNYNLNLSKVEEYDALADTPITLNYEQLKDSYPRAKFILTIRDIESWLVSCEKWFTPESLESADPVYHDMHTKIYGTRYFDAKSFTETWYYHFEQVLAKFSDSPNLLIYRICNGDGWKPLCDFLYKDIPDKPFPIENRSRV